MAISLAILLALGQAPQIGQAPKLKDIVIFDGKKLGQGVDAPVGAIIDKAPEGGLPLDTAQPFGETPSMRVMVSGQGKGEWSVTLAGRDWLTYDLEPYHARGSLELTLKGAKGGESFRLAIHDNDPIRRSSTIFMERVKVPGTDWSKVIIPLKRLIRDPNPFRLRQTWFLRLSDAVEATFWIGDVRFTSPDLERSEPPVKVNQLGWEPEAPKRFVVSGFSSQLSAREGTPFQVVNSLGRTAFSGKLKLEAPYDPISGEKVLSGDFSGLRAAGLYKVVVPGVGESLSFEIKPGLYSQLLKDSARYYYHQRSGIALVQRFAGPFSRPLGHPGDVALPYQSGKPGTRDASGGWYDAGDYGKYVSMAGPPVSDLLWVYEMNPKLFPDGQLGIPESGNGVPDLLDEIRWEVEWILKMQDAERGGFYQKVWPNNSNLMPGQDKTKRMIYDKVGEEGGVLATATTANAVMALGHAAIVFAPWDKPFAEKCRKAALDGWKYLDANPTDIVVTGMTGADDDDDDNRLAAAFVLFRLTGEPKFHDPIRKEVRRFDRIWSSQNDNGIGDLTLTSWPHYLKSKGAEPSLLSWHRTKFSAWREGQLKRLEGLAWRNFLLEEDYYWGSNSVALQTLLVLAMNGKPLGLFGERDMKAAQMVMDYILGANPMRFSYVSGYGENSVERIYSHIYSNDAYDPIPPGYLAGGPNKYEGAFFSNFAGKCYRDVPTEWTTNENAIYWNSNLVHAASLLAAKTGR